MKRHTLEVHAESTASPEEVWRLLADVTTWPDWTRFDEASYEREGTPAPHGIGAVRAFRVGRLRSRDTVVAFDPPRRLSYTYDGPLPIRDYRADVTLSDVGDRTRITWHAEFAGTFPFAGALTRRFLINVLQEIASRLGDTATTATTSPAGEG